MSDFQLHHFDKLPSTNQYALEYLDSLPHHTVILANSQSDGYGRFSRAWHSPDSQNIYMSIILKPELNKDQVQNLANLTQCMSIAISDVLEEYKVKSTLKWPNDVQVNGFKIAGILSETKMIGNTLKGYILGVGVNLNMTNEDNESIDQPATSLNLLTGKHIDRDSFLNNILNAFFKQYPDVIQNGFIVIEQSYLNKINFLNQSITVKTFDSTIKGIAAGFTLDGQLILRQDSGEITTVSAGDIHLD